MQTTRNILQRSPHRDISRPSRTCCCSDRYASFGVLFSSCQWGINIRAYAYERQSASFRCNIMVSLSFLLPLICAAVSWASPLVARAEPDPSLATSVTAAGQTFVNKVRENLGSSCARYIYLSPGLGRIWSDPCKLHRLHGYVNRNVVPAAYLTIDVGDTLGGIGSAIALKRGSFTTNSDGTFSGTSPR